MFYLVNTGRIIIRTKFGFRFFQDLKQNVLAMFTFKTFRMPQLQYCKDCSSQQSKVKVATAFGFYFYILIFVN